MDHNRSMTGNSATNLIVADKIETEIILRTKTKQKIYDNYHDHQ